MTAELTSLRKKYEIEQADIEYRPELVLCADDTPSRQPDMVAEFGYTGDTHSEDKVTDGTYIPPPNTDEYTSLFLSCIHRPAHIKNNIIPKKFSTSDYVRRWKTRMKRISSSICGRLFGHYKVLNLLPARYQGIFAIMTNIPYHTGYSAKRW